MAFIHYGPQYDFSKIKLDSLDDNLKRRLSYSSVTNKAQYLDLRRRAGLICANEGYPFAKLKLQDGQEFLEGRSALLVLEKGPLVIVDSLRINGSTKLSKRFLEKYLQISEGDIYRHKKLTAVQSKLQRLNYVEQFESPQLTFFGDYASLDIYLNNKNSSRFDFLFGIIPTNNFADRSLFLSIDLTAEMQNKLGNGEYILVDFERLRPEQQRFEFKFNYPYILSLDYGVDIDFSIFRLGLDYQTLISDIGIEYIINTTDRLKLSWNYESTNIVELDTTLLLTTQSLPEDLDISQNGLSAELNINRLDYLLNPRRGYSIGIKATAGLKKINRNTSILALKNDAVDFGMAYDSLDLRSARYEVRADLQNYIPIANRSAIGTRVQLGWRYSEQGLYRNEKFQIGGNKLLRGFDEAQFFTSYYAVTSIDYRILLDNNSYLSAPFVDLAMIENASGESIWAIGIGAGLGIETQAGIFSFSIAAGRTEEVSFDLRRPKAHFGYISLF